MKNTWKKLIAASLLLVAASTLRGRAAVTVYADETPSTNVMATTEAATVTNDDLSTSNAVAGSAAKHGKAKSFGETPPVRIDETGVHVGGVNPVDINVPRFARHGEQGIDVVGIVAVVFGCTIPIAIVAMVLSFRHRRLKMQHEMMRTMIDKGLPIPPEMLNRQNEDAAPPKLDGTRRVRNDLRGGLILVGVGAGLLMIAGKVGWILVFIGAARLVVWLIEDRNH